MFNWLKTAFSRARDARERSEIAHRVDQLELEWNDVLDKLRAREERERKRKRADVAAAAAPCGDCGDQAFAPPVQNDPLKGDLWSGARAKFSGNRRVQ